MDVIKGHLKRLVVRLPFSMQRRFGRSRIFFPYYHLVSDAPTPHYSSYGEFAPTAKKFSEDLDFFLRHFRPIDLHQLIAHLRRGAPLPENPFLLSFDDGYREVYEVAAPILEKKGVPATLFLNTSSLDNKEMIFYNKLGLLAQGRDAREVAKLITDLDFFAPEELDRRCAEAGIDVGGYLRSVAPYLTSAQVSALIERGFTVGAHSVHHPPYARLSVEAQVRETTACLEELKQRFSLDYAAFAFPGSDDGVSREFFRRIEREVDVTFGTSAGVTDDIPRHFQRTSFETSHEPAALVLAERYGVELLKRLARRDRKQR